MRKGLNGTSFVFYNYKKQKGDYIISAVKYYFNNDNFYLAWNQNLQGYDYIQH